MVQKTFGGSDRSRCYDRYFGIVRRLYHNGIRNAKHAGMEAISSYGIRLSDSYTKGMDISQIEQFLKDPKENDLYWQIRQQLDTYRTQIGALYVYVVRFDDQKRPLIMIDGQPKGSDVASPINEETDIAATEVETLLKGESASSAIIDNPKYGKYISTYTPVKMQKAKSLLFLVSIRRQELRSKYPPVS